MDSEVEELREIVSRVLTADNIVSVKDPGTIIQALEIGEPGPGKAILVVGTLPDGGMAEFIIAVNGVQLDKLEEVFRSAFAPEQFRDLDTKTNVSWEVPVPEQASDKASERNGVS